MLRLVRLLARLVILLVLPGSSVRAGVPTTRRLEPERPVDATLAPGERHAYSISLRSGQFLHVEVEQNHLDAAVRILSPDGAVIAEVDNVADLGEPLTLSATVTQDGLHRVEIRLRARDSTPGRYTLAAARPRSATADDGKRVSSERLRAEADQLAARASGNLRKQALERYEETLATWREIGDRREEAATLSRICNVLEALGEGRQVLSRAAQALDLWRLEGDRRGEAAALYQLGVAHSDVGEQRRALELLEQALALQRADRNLRGQAESLDAIAVARGALGEKPEAIARYTEALGLARAAGHRPTEAMILKDRALDYLSLGETDRALADLWDALVRYRQLGDRHQEGVTEYSIGNAYLERSDLPAAWHSYGRALALLRTTGDRRFEAFTLNHMGLVHLAGTKPHAALPEFERALALLRDCDDRRAVAMIEANVGRALLEMGDAVHARARLLEALPEVRASGDRVHEAKTLTHLARAERALGDLQAARTWLEEALRLTESLRESIPAAGSRASFMATIRTRYDLLVDVLMDLDSTQPGNGWDAEALHASERAKARSLVELLAESRVDLREGVDRNLLARERSLDEQLEKRRREEQQRQGGAPAVGVPAPDDRALDALLFEYEDVEGRIRTASPRYAALARPQPLTLKEIREQVLDPDTLLLEYALGEKRSFLWAVTSDSLASRELPGRAAVEAAARSLHLAWSSGNSVDPAEGHRRALALSRMLLGPVADQLGNRRLVIVGEGMLLYVPFAALPSPRGSPASVPLLAGHEVVTLPSATTLSVLRREASGRKAPERRVAVLADPVFDRSDPRVLGKTRPGSIREPSGPGDDALTRSMQESGLRHLDRLAASRLEARAIAGLAGSGKTYSALDFQASRDSALGPDVAGARIVHFASHALLNARHPELSGIVLSLVDDRGRPVDGFLQTRDIYKMRLSADLVVLSACQTALGKEVRGEGVIGLTRGFMYAGAPTVLASLWKVPDRATAELMKVFYRGMLAEGLRPAAALRRAQVAIRRQKKWTAPYYWAGFVLQGDWR